MTSLNLSMSRPVTRGHQAIMLKFCISAMWNNEKKLNKQRAQSITEETTAGKIVF